jgi:hypothetical protein
MSQITDLAAKLTALEATVADLKARVQELEDDRGIRDALARYGYTADTCKDEEFVELYTEDGRMKIAASAKAKAVFGSGDWVLYEGREGIRDFITHPKGHHSPALYGKSMHLQGNNLVTDIKGDEAFARGYQVAIINDDNGSRVLSAGNNLWQLRKVNGRWLIAERRGAYLGDDKFTGNLDEEPTAPAATGSRAKAKPRAAKGAHKPAAKAPAKRASKSVTGSRRERA